MPGGQEKLAIELANLSAAGNEVIDFKSAARLIAASVPGQQRTTALRSVLRCARET